MRHSTENQNQNHQNSFSIPSLFHSIMEEYKTFLHDILDNNHCTIEQDAALKRLRNKETFEYLKSLQIDTHGWIYNELAIHTELVDPGTDAHSFYLKSYEQQNIFGSINYIKKNQSMCVEKKIELLTELCNNGYKDHYLLCLILGAIYLNLGTKENLARATYYLYLSAGQGMGYAHHLIGQYLSANAALKYSLFEKAVNSKFPHTESLSELGKMSLTGFGCNQDLYLAFSFFERCHQLHPCTALGSACLYKLSTFYIFCKGTVPQDLKKGFTYLFQAKNQGDPDTLLYFEREKQCGRTPALECIGQMLQQEENLQAENATLRKLLTFRSFDLNQILKHEMKSLLI